MCLIDKLTREAGIYFSGFRKIGIECEEEEIFAELALTYVKAAQSYNNNQNNSASLETFVGRCFLNRMKDYKTKLCKKSFFVCVDDFDDIPSTQCNVDINLIIEEIKERLNEAEEQIFDCMLHGPGDFAGISKKTGMNRNKIDYSIIKIREKVRKYNG